MTALPGNGPRRPRTRKRVLRDAFAGALAVSGALAATSATASARVGAEDAKILNFLLELERLQSSFFERARNDNRFGAEVRQLARLTGEHDQAHARALRSLLGSAARTPSARVESDPKDDASFIRDALALKEAAVAAYIGEAANLGAELVTEVASIVSVEARHAAWLRSLADVIPAPRAADRSQTPGNVVRSLEGSGIARLR